jgi:NAD(P)-dependent dehydrogenase (short-subunit alcohol dehydrogenase family)
MRSCGGLLQTFCVAVLVSGNPPLLAGYGDLTKCLTMFPREVYYQAGSEHNECNDVRKEEAMSNGRESSEFEGRVAIITGAARGIGKATALAFSKNGATVVIVDVLKSELKKTTEIIKKIGPVLALTADVSDNAQIQNVIKSTIDAFGRIDILVNNAGVGDVLGPVVSMAEEDWDRILRINLKSVFLFCKGVLPYMLKAKKGSIVNLGSLAGKEGNENMAAYSVSKAGVICLSRALAKEVARDGIRVNSIAPALTRTAFTAIPPKEVIDFLVGKIPMGRMAEPEEMANAILFLCSDKASFITGQCYNVSGGRGDY